MKDLNELADAVHALARSKGWHDDNEGVDAFIERTCNNMHDEVSELHTAWRDNQLFKSCDKAGKMADCGLPPLNCLEEELADIIIRALDSARKLNVDILRAIQIKHDFNKTRSMRHGGKRS